MYLLLAVPLLLAQEPPPKCSVSGTVVNSVTGDPLNKVDLVLLGSASTVSDAAGHFCFTDVEPGRYRLIGVRQGFLESTYGAKRDRSSGTTIAFEAGQEIKGLVMKMTPFAVIAGTVRGIDGEPLIDAEVNVYTMTHEAGKPKLEGRGNAKTDDLGQYRVRDLPPGTYYVSATPPENRRFWALRPGAKPGETGVLTYYPNTTRSHDAMAVKVPAGARITSVDITVRSEQTYQVRGKVISNGRDSVEDIGVYLEDEDENHSFLADNKEGTGEFVFPAVPPGVYSLNTRGRNLGSPRGFLTVEVVDRSVEGLRVVLGPTAEVKGRIIFEGDNKSDFQRERGVWLMGPSNLGGVGNIDDELAFTVRDVLPGTYQVKVMGDPRTFYQKSIRCGDVDVLRNGLAIAEGATANIEVVLASDFGSVSGTVLDKDGQPAAGATVLLVPDASQRRRDNDNPSTSADQNGRFEQKAVPPGDYKLFALDAGIDPDEFDEEEFLKTNKDRGTAVTVKPKTAATAQLKLIPPKE